MNSLLEVQGLQVFSKSQMPLSPVVNFVLQPGEVLFLKGDNGSGKSSILKTLLRLHSHFQGFFQFHVDNAEIEYLPQLGHLNFHLPLTLADMLDKGVDSPLLKGLDLNKKWNTASGGERQKVLFSAVLAKRPRILILDEPFNHVDHQSGYLLEQSLLQFLKDNPRSAMILVSHRTLSAENVNLRTVEVR